MRILMGCPKPMADTDITQKFNIVSKNTLILKGTMTRDFVTTVLFHQI
jgi:hypothetical protein